MSASFIVLQDEGTYAVASTAPRLFTAALGRNTASAVQAARRATAVPLAQIAATLEDIARALMFGGRTSRSWPERPGL
jgi:hypothetical protein